MGIPIERQPEILRDGPPSREPLPLTATEGALFKFLSSEEGRLRTWDEISQELWHIPSDPSQMGNIRTRMTYLRSKLNGEGKIYSVAEWGGGPGAFFSSESLEETEITLRDLGVSLFSQTENGELILPGLSLLSPEFTRNPLIDPDKVLRLMDRLVLVTVGGYEPYFKPYLSPSRRRILACLSQGGLWSKEQLVRAIKTKPTGNSLYPQLNYLRKKLAGEGLEIFSYQGVGWILGERPDPNLPFSCQIGPRGQSEILRKVNMLHAHPGEAKLHSPHLERHKSSQLPIELLNFVLKEENIGRCLTFQEVWRTLYGNDFYHLETENRRMLSILLCMARKVLKKAAPDENWYLATFREQDKMIALQGEPGDKVELPGLYPEAKAELAPLMERGTLKGNATINTTFTSQQTSVLLALGRRPGRLVGYETLRRRLWGANGENELANTNGRGNNYRLATLICNLRRNLRPMEAEIRIENLVGVGYALVLESS